MGPGRSFTASTPVTWRVVHWTRSDDRRWKIFATSDHPHSDLATAMAVARQWIQPLGDAIEHGNQRVQVDPVHR